MSFRSFTGVSLDFVPGDSRVIEVYGKRLVEARRLSSLSRSKLAAKSGASVRVIRMIERAEKSRVAFAFMEAVASWLHVKPEWCSREPIAELHDFFLCRANDPCECGKEYAPLLCDADLGEKGTCDAPLCDECTFRWGTLDICSQHRYQGRRRVLAS